MIDEGYIKFRANWTPSAPIAQSKIEKLNHWRQAMYRLDLIGAYESGIGFGNISQRIDDSNQFYITGSKTGNFETLDASHFARVTQVNVEQNTLTCIGATIASSESMSHAVIYEHCGWVNGVIHIHNLALWQKLLYQLPTTPAAVTYGSPAMAYAIVDLLENTDATAQKIFLMAGHEEGIFVFGHNLAEAAAVIQSYL